MELTSIAIQEKQQAYIVGAAKYAEKLEEKDKIIESKDRELAELKELLNYYKDKADKGEGILKSATDIHFVPGKEGDNLLAAKDREIEQLTQDIKDQGEYLKEMINVNVLNDAFNSGEEWRKNHKVKEGEQFTDYFLRVFEVEKEDRDRELAQLKEELSKLKNEKI